jgi:hypothetical protein
VKKLVAISAVALAWALSSAAQAADTDPVAWFTAIPGLEGGAQTKVAGVTRTTYTVSGDIRSVLAQIVRGLQDREWIVRRSRGLSVLGGEVPSADIRTVRASQGARSLRVNVLGSKGSYSLLVRLARLPSAAPALPAKPTHAGHATAKAPPATADKIEIADNNATRTIDCSQVDVVSLAGNNCHVTLTGMCDALEVQGSKNTVAIKGSIDEIAAFGNDNEVSWLPAANPDTPRVSVFGSGNKVGPR